MPQLRELFRRHGKCFIPFVTAGHPDLESTEKILLALSDAGSQIIEIGIPFSDPIADGPIIQRSSFHALQHGYTVEDYLELIRRVRDRIPAGLIFMTYLNPVLRYGLTRLSEQSVAAGLDGISISDLTPEEFVLLQQRHTGSWLSVGLETIFLAAPTSSEERLQSICAVGSGFVYLVARTGVTGRQSDVGAVAPQTVARLRRYTDLPIAVGFGITSSDDVRKVWRYADAAVVGSAIVRFIQENRRDPALARRVYEYVKKDLIPSP